MGGVSDHGDLQISLAIHTRLEGYAGIAASDVDLVLPAGFNVKPDGNVAVPPGEPILLVPE